jgi:hypothetical protein
MKEIDIKIFLIQGIRHFAQPNSERELHRMNGNSIVFFHHELQTKTCSKQNQTDK